MYPHGFTRDFELEIIQNGQVLSEISAKQCRMMIAVYLTQFLTVLDDQWLVLKLTGWRIDTRTRTRPGFNP